MICIPIKTTSSAVKNRWASWIVFLEFYTFCWPKSLNCLMKSKYLSSWAFAFLIKQRVARKLRYIDFLKLNYLCIMEKIPYNTWVLNQTTRHASASFVNAQTVMGPAILRATRIYRRRSVMLIPLSITYLNPNSLGSFLLRKNSLTWDVKCEKLNFRKS